MKKALLIIAFALILTKEKLYLTVPIQSVFFILALKSSNILSSVTSENIPPKNIKLVKGAAIIICGLIISSLLLSFTVFHGARLFPFMGFGIVSSLCFLCFYFLIAAMRLRNASFSALRTTAVICILLLCLSLIEPYTAQNKHLETALLLVAINTFMLLFLLFMTNKINKKEVKH